jgi:hypothetical protein
LKHLEAALLRNQALVTLVWKMPAQSFGAISKVFDALAAHPTLQNLTLTNFSEPKKAWQGFANLLRNPTAVRRLQLQSQLPETDITHLVVLLEQAVAGSALESVELFGFRIPDGDAVRRLRRSKPPILMAQHCAAPTYAPLLFGI